MRAVFQNGIFLKSFIFHEDVSIVNIGLDHQVIIVSIGLHLLTPSVYESWVYTRELYVFKAQSSPKLTIHLIRIKFISRSLLFKNKIIKIQQKCFLKFSVTQTNIYYNAQHHRTFLYRKRFSTKKQFSLLFDIWSTRLTQNKCLLLIKFQKRDVLAKLKNDTQHGRWRHAPFSTIPLNGGLNCNFLVLAITPNCLRTLQSERCPRRFRESLQVPVRIGNTSTNPFLPLLLAAS